MICSLFLLVWADCTFNEHNLLFKKLFFKIRCLISLRDSDEKGGTETAAPLRKGTSPRQARCAGARRRGPGALSALGALPAPAEPCPLPLRPPRGAVLL